MGIDTIESDAIERQRNEIFISYSRKDKAFVQTLSATLERLGYSLWVDWEDIQPTEDWWAAIQVGIEAASNFIFVLSPDSIASKVCGQELEHAVANHKRLVPLVWREGFDATVIHPALATHNWLFFREIDDQDHALRTLTNALDTDLEYVRAHTRLQMRAIEWEQKARNDSLLMRGSDLEEAELWLTQATGKKPEPTELQGAFINTSRKAETARHKTEMLRQQFLTGVVSAFLVVAVGMAGFAFKQKSKAEILAQSSGAQKLLASGLELEALIKSLRTGRQMRQIRWFLEPGTQLRAITALRQIVYGVRLHNTLQGHRGYVMSASFSPDGQTIASASADKTIKLWSREGRLLETFTGHRDRVNSVTFSPDGQTLVSASADQTVKVWNRDGQLLKTLQGHDANVLSASVSPDGKLIASSDQDGSIKLWNFSGKLVRTFSREGYAVANVQFSPDGQTIRHSGW